MILIIFGQTGCSRLYLTSSVGEIKLDLKHDNLCLQIATNLNTKNIRRITNINDDQCHQSYLLILHCFPELVVCCPIVE